jgi:hypothetical protein
LMSWLAAIESRSVAVSVKLVGVDGTRGDCFPRRMAWLRVGFPAAAHGQRMGDDLTPYHHLGFVLQLVLQHRPQ